MKLNDALKLATPAVYLQKGDKPVSHFLCAISVKPIERVVYNDALFRHGFRLLPGIPQVLKGLRDVEWSRKYTNEDATCPVCRQSREGGYHAEECSIGKAIRICEWAMEVPGI